MSYSNRILLRDAALWVAFLTVVKCCPAPTCPPLSEGLAVVDSVSAPTLVDGLLECEVR